MSRKEVFRLRLLLLMQPETKEEELSDGVTNNMFMETF